jgi:hypothetical protein
MMEDFIALVGRCAMLAIVLAIPTCAYKGCFSDEAVAERQEERAKKAAQVEADKQPRVVREADGCKVYAFKSGEHWHFFTRCPSTTTTDRTYDVRQGKTTVQKVEQIVTENK